MGSPLPAAMIADSVAAMRPCRLTETGFGDFHLRSKPSNPFSANTTWRRYFSFVHPCGTSLSLTSIIGQMIDWLSGIREHVEAQHLDIGLIVRLPFMSLRVQRDVRVAAEMAAGRPGAP